MTLIFPDLEFLYSCIYSETPSRIAWKESLRDNMFHTGNLQSGIGLAVQQSKAVLSFVAGMLSFLHATFGILTFVDDGQTSRDWEQVLMRVRGL